MYIIEIIGRAQDYGCKEDTVNYLDEFIHQSHCLYRTDKREQAAEFKDYKQAACAFFSVLGYYRYFECIYEIKVVNLDTDKIEIRAMSNSFADWGAPQSFKDEVKAKNKKLGRNVNYD